MKKLLGVVATLVLAGIALSGARAAEFTYTYHSAPTNPLFDLPPLSSGPDTITISFSVPVPLAANSFYNLSVDSGPTAISHWTASDSLFGIALSGVNAPIELVPAPGLMAGGALTYCNISLATCFGGAIATDGAGQINQWNLVADGAPGSPYLSFITYDNPFLGSIDGLGSVQQGLDELELNQGSLQAGAWSGPSTSAVPEPGAWTLLLAGAGVAGVLMRQRRTAGWAAEAQITSR